MNWAASHPPFGEKHEFIKVVNIMAEIKANRYLVVIFTLWHCYYCICNETVFNHPARSASRAFSGKRDKAKRDKRGSACVVVFNKLLVGSNSEIETCQGPMTMSS